MPIDPNETVRIKYTHDHEIQTRVSGGVVPSKGERVCITSERDTKATLYDREWYTVEEVIWTISDSAERKPDVVTIQLKEYDPEELER